MVNSGIPTLASGLLSWTLDPGSRARAALSRDAEPDLTDLWTGVFTWGGNEKGGDLLRVH